MLQSSNQYLRPDYMVAPTAIPHTQKLDTKSSPLALLAQTCSAIGADTTNPKLLAANIEKATKAHKSSSSSSLDNRDKSSPLSSHSSVSTGSVEQQQQQQQQQQLQQPTQQQQPIKCSFKPYETNNNHIRERLDNDNEQATNLTQSHSQSRVKTPKTSSNSLGQNGLQNRCDSNQSASSQRGDSPAINGGLRRTPSLVTSQQELTTSQHHQQQQQQQQQHNSHFKRFYFDNNDPIYDFLMDLLVHKMADGGHTFVKKNFHKPTYCHHCSDILWFGLIGQGYICEVCNFIIHERCVTNVVTPCSGIAPCIIKNPVAHCWSEPTTHKKKFCTVCRKRLDETPSVHCIVCEYYAHLECQDFAVPDCTENATYVPGKELLNVKHQHHWREGNLPSNSKCVYCKKTCWSSECLTGYRCEWCGLTTHAGCRMYLPTECTFGCLQPIYLPPHCVSIPRTEVPIKEIMGVRKTESESNLVREYSCPRSISEEFSSGDTPRFKDEESVDRIEAMAVVPGGSAAGCSSGGSSSHHRPDSQLGHKSDKSDKEKEKKEKEREEKDIEAIKVFDGNNSFRRQLYRVIVVPRTYTLEQLLTTALRAFHISRDPSAFYLTDLYAPAGNEDAPLQDPNPVLSLNHLEGKRPAIFLRFHDRDNGFVRVYPGKLQCSVEEPYVSVPVDTTTTIKDLIRDALDRFGLADNQIDDYRCSQVLLDSGVTERILSITERPLNIMKQMGKDSIRQMELMRFYMQHSQDPHGPNIALFVGNLDPGKSQRKYEDFLNKYLNEDSKFTSIGPIYYEYGSVVLTYEDAQKAVRAFYILREVRWDGKDLLVMLLPNIEPSMVPADINPLLVFVNVKSGGCQGLELISNFRKLLNPFQVFNLENGGPLPGLYVFRHIPHYKILVCGGDGTVGWVLQCLDNVGQDSECSSPPCAILPLGTGNDLARVLCWGTGYTGDQDPLSYLREVIDAEDIRLDRWTVVFHPEEKPEEQTMKVTTNTTGAADDECEGTKNEDNTQIFVMNNYFGIGLDADLCLDFHNARMENPFKFNSRLHNKGVYVKMGLRKMMTRKCTKDLQKEMRLEVDGKVVELPPCEGIIILNILSWGSGANPWGPDKDDRFSPPNHYDGLLEIVGVTGVVHLGQIQSGIRYANRIAQGGHIKMHLHSDLPVQVDGEPWVQCSGDIVVLKSALRATMLKKVKNKMKRRNTEPTMALTNQQMALALPPTTAEGDSESEIPTNNTDF